VERWILAALRNRTFFSVAEANEVVGELLIRLNNRPFKKLPGSRSSQFELLDRPMLNPLPATRYEFAEWKHARAGIDYHVEVDRHYYSVPFQLFKQQLDVRITSTTIECFAKGKQVATHLRAWRPGHTTIPEHMPQSHRRYAEWTPERIINWSSSIGEKTAEVTRQIMARRQHPEQGFRACMGLISMAKKHGNSRLEAACKRAVISNCVSYKSIKSILTTGLDSQPLPETEQPSTAPKHDNIRGSRYYH